MDERLKQLMDYTKFHIGMYVTLVSVLVGFISKDYTTLVSTSFHYWLLVTICLLVVSGMAGGLIASSIPDHVSYDIFISTRLGPWGAGWIRARECTHLEHTTFWLAAVNGVVGLIVSTYLPKPGPWQWAAIPATVGIVAVVMAFVRSAAAGHRERALSKEPLQPESSAHGVADTSQP